ncbi:MAG: hypothetical protein LBM98_10985 [Oscillospiraceae bacterium]|nr:hypothetical protein [Oscillospiraceae bacterium]
MVWTWVRRARRGEPPRRYAVRSLPRGEFTGEASATPQPRNPRPNLFPSWEGCPRRGGVVVPPISRELYYKHYNPAGGFETRPYGMAQNYKPAQNIINN